MNAIYREPLCSTCGEPHEIWVRCHQCGRSRCPSSARGELCDDCIDRAYAVIRRASRTARNDAPRPPADPRVRSARYLAVAALAGWMLTLALFATAEWIHFVYMPSARLGPRALRAMSAPLATRTRAMPTPQPAMSPAPNAPFATPPEWRPELLADAGPTTDSPVELVRRAFRLRDAGLDLEVQTTALSWQQIRAAESDPALDLHGPRVVPHVVDGRVIGVRVFRVDSSPLASAIGLRDGDTVTAVNGASVAQPDRALETYADVMRARVAVLEVLRGARRVVLVVRWPADPSAPGRDAVSAPSARSASAGARRNTAPRRPRA